MKRKAQIDANKILPTDYEMMENQPLDVQVGGRHYELQIQPVEYIVKNGLGFCEGNVIKYVTRYKVKGGKEDLLKARHYIDMLIKFNYGDEWLITPAP